VKPDEMPLVQDDHLVQAFAPDVANQPLRLGILPRCFGGNQDFFDPHVPDVLPIGELWMLLRSPGRLRAKRGAK
jgi:hypothetical protein